MRALFAVCLWALAMVVFGCGDTDDCMSACVSPQHSEGWCKDASPDVGGCKGVNESVGEAALPLSTGLTVYTITSQSAPGTPTACNDPNNNTWCKCGTDYTDNAARCNTATETLILHVPALGCEVSSATLSYQATMWSGASPVEIHRILRPLTDPTMGVAGLCATTAMASWYRSGPEAWTTPGGQGNGSDRSVTSVGHILASGGNRTESFDVTALVGGCGSGCVLAQYNTGSVHVNVLGGTASLVYTCASPPATCGDGVVEGAETCDDGNALAGDGCSATCALEAGWTCATPGQPCTTTCGDGVKAGSEACDDGNLVSHDGCSSTCTAEVCVWQ